MVQRMAWSSAPRRRGALALAILAVAGSAAAFPLPWRRAKPAAPAAAAASATTPRASDSSIRQGRLANGLAWAIQPIPGAPISLRLEFSGRQAAGFANVAALADISRRLAFAGLKTRHGEARALAAAHDLVFSPDQTAAPLGLAGATWRFDGVKDGSDLQAALAILRAVAEGPPLDQKAIDAARDAAASAARSPKDLQRRIYLARAAFLLGVDPAAGAIEPPARLSRASLAAFAAAANRPDEAVLTVAGDVDPALAEAGIATLFRDWRPRGGAPAPAIPPGGGARAVVFVDSGAPASVQLSWRPDAPTGGAAADPVESLAAAVINDRLAGLAAGSDQSVSGAALLADDSAGVRTASLLAGTDPEHWRQALAALDLAARRSSDDPLGADELAAAIAAERQRLVDRAGAAATAPSAAADDLAADLMAGRAPTTAAEDLAAFDHGIGAVTPEAVRGAIKALFAGRGPLIFVTAPAPIDGGEAAVLAAYQTARAAPLTSQVHATPLAWPYADFGAPGAIAGQREIPDLDAVFVRIRERRATDRQTGQVRADLGWRRRGEGQGAGRRRARRRA